MEWKTYGIILKIHPTMTEGGKIRTQVNAEVSAVDHGSGTSDVPGFLTRRVSTLFSTPPGETVMLSGLVKSEMAKDVAKVPLLGQIPVIGELFKSRKLPREPHGARDLHHTDRGVRGRRVRGRQLGAESGERDGAPPLSPDGLMNTNGEGSHER